MKRIPVELRTVSKAYALETWVEGNTCRLDAFFEVIDGGLKLLEKANPTRVVEPSSVVILLCEALDCDGALEEYVIEEKDRDVEDAQTWQDILKAASWRIYEKYTKARKEGD